MEWNFRGDGDRFSRRRNRNGQINSQGRNGKGMRNLVIGNLRDLFAINTLNSADCPSDLIVLGHHERGRPAIMGDNGEFDHRVLRC